MGAFSETRQVNHPPALLYRVVSDIAAYPLFLPWCKSAEQVPPPAGLALAPATAAATTSFWQLHVGWGAFRGSYVSQVTAQPDPHGGGEITAQAVAGALRQLDSTWKIAGQETTNSNAETSLVEFSVTFSFRGLLMERAAEAAFSVVAARLAQAFARRAEQLRLVKALEE